jgi:hypothetical protein
MRVGVFQDSRLTALMHVNLILLYGLTTDAAEISCMVWQNVRKTADAQQIEQQIPIASDCALQEQIRG